MTEYIITRKLNHYRKQLALLYRGSQDFLLEDIVAKSPIYVNEGYKFDNWDGGRYGHRLTFYPKDDVFAKIGGLDKIKEISERLRNDFTQVFVSVENEWIDEVFIELFDPEDEECQNAIQPDDISKVNGENTSLWIPGHIKLFISHRDKHKEEVGELAGYLKPYGISCFVAHRDIEPTEEWRNEIENALRSMDIFLAYLTDDFSGGNWTNQEVGFAIARGVPIIPVKMPSLDPYGFMEIYQGMKGNPDHLSSTANKIFELIRQKFDGRDILKRSMISAFVQSTSYIDTIDIFRRLEKFPQFSAGELDRLVSGYNSNDQIFSCGGINNNNKFFNFIQLRSNNSFEKIDGRIRRAVEDEIPF